MPGADASPAATAPVLMQVLAQQESADPFLDRVNAELDGRDGAAESESAAAEEPPTRGAFYYLRVFSALCLVVGLILVSGYLARRAAGRTPLLAGDDLGRILGRLYLNRNATIFFVETGGKVLLIGSTGQSLTTLAQFDAAQFQPEEEAGEPAGFNPESFLAQLSASSQAMRAEAPREDDEMRTLRRDIERLQDYLREESRETSD